jgi:hypothetical protein
MSEVSTQSGGPDAAPSTGEKVSFEPLKDHFGEPAEYDPDRYPEGSPAREGSMTRPSGQGGASPKRRPDYQDQWPEMPEPSESAKAKGEENDRVARGEVTEVELANERLAGITGTTPEDQTA